MNDEHDSAVNAAEHERLQQQQEDDERRLREGRKVLGLKNRKLPDKDRETFARNLWYQLQRHGLKRRDLAEACDLEAKEIYRRVLKPSDQAKPNRLRASLHAYRELIIGLATLANTDRYLLAEKIAYGTSVHPSSGPASSEVEWITRQLYDIADGVNEMFQLSERFEALSDRKRMLPISDPFACWPSTRCWTSDTDPDPLHTDFWGGDDLFEDARLLQFIRYVPHFCIGILDSFDDDWPVDRSQRRGLYRKRLSSHPEREKLQTSNRARLADTVGDLKRLRLEWDERGEQLSINGKPEEEFLDANKEHKRGHLQDIGLDPNEDPCSDDIVCEHGTWICLYPSDQVVQGARGVSNLIPVIVEYYGGGGANEDIYLHPVDYWLTPVVSERLIGGGTIGNRLVDALSMSDKTEAPELKTELMRTAPFIENHPLLKKYRRMEAGERHIRAWREEVSRKL